MPAVVSSALQDLKLFPRKAAEPHLHGSLAIAYLVAVGTLPELSQLFQPALVTCHILIGELNVMVGSPMLRLGIRRLHDRRNDSLWHRGGINVAR
jgi:hypothetical protein